MIVVLTWAAGISVAACAALGIRVLINSRRIRRERAWLDALHAQQRRPATGETIRLRPIEPPREPPCRRRTDPLPADLRRGGDTLRVIARRRPRS